MVLNAIFSQKQKPSDYNQPLQIVYTHCIMKGTQLGLALAPFFAVFNGFQKRRLDHIFKYNLRYGLRGIFFGGWFGYLLCSYKFSGQTLQQNQSRAWQLMRNSGQNRIDTLTYLGFIFGGILGNLIKLDIFRQGFLGASIFGSQIGLYSNVIIFFFPSLNEPQTHQDQKKQDIIKKK